MNEYHCACNIITIFLQKQCLDLYKLPKILMDSLLKISCLKTINKI